MKIEYNDKTIIFPLPPDEDYIEEIRPEDKEEQAVGGNRQVIQYSQIATLFQRFSMLPRDFVDGELREFFTGHALFGREFKYYLDPESEDFKNYHMDDRVFLPKKNAATVDRYDIEFTLRRIL